VNGKELYDIQADPGQAKDVARQFPEIVRRLRADCEAWWADISPVFKIDSRIIIGHEAESPSRLTCHDWLTLGGRTPWNQNHIRKMGFGLGEWALKVQEAGTYTISLRRWPRATGAGVNATLPAGKPVPGLSAFREAPGKALNAKNAGIEIGKIKKEVPVKANADEVTFEVELDKGEVNLIAYFIQENNKKIGAYYAYVEKQ